MPVPAKQVADVAEPAGLAVDEVLALAAAVDAAGDVDLAGVDRQLAVGVVEGERDFGGAERAARSRSR